MSSLFQRIVLAIAILEIPLQIDRYFLYHEEDAQFGALGGLNVSLLTIGLVLLYGMWLVEAALCPKTERERKRTIWGLPLLAYIAIAALSAVAAQKWMLTFFEVAMLVQAYLLFFYIANRMQTRGDSVFIVCLLAVSLLLQGFIVTGTCLIGGPRSFPWGL